MERPILFSAPMVRALLAGTKTQTRRIVKPQPVKDGLLWMFKWGAACSGEHMPAMPGHATAAACPYGVPGDRLWVRETWAKWRNKNGDKWAFCYAATHEGELVLDDGDGYTAVRRDGHTPRSPWRPSIHMPRSASRITLEVTGVRVERLQEISEADADAEGADGGRYLGQGFDHCAYREAYRTLWESINGPGSWDANPFVWVISFRRIHAC